jgi:hypothetical protein
MSTIQCGDFVAVKATLFGETYAKKEWGKDWRTAKEHFTVLARAEEGSEVWICRSHDYEDLEENIHEKDIAPNIIDELPARFKHGDGGMNSFESEEEYASDGDESDDEEGTSKASKTKSKKRKKASSSSTKAR